MSDYWDGNNIDVAPPTSPKEFLDLQIKFQESCVRKECFLLEMKMSKCLDKVKAGKIKPEICAKQLIDFADCVAHCTANRFCSSLEFKRRLIE